MKGFSRREFLATLSAIGLAPMAFANERGGGAADASPAFLHGVASGDPLHDRVILWTRVTPKQLSDVIQGRYTIATDQKMKRVIRTGTFATDVTRDFTVKIDALGLWPDSTYYYRFEARGCVSPIGRTRTLPFMSARKWRMAFASCSNYPYGYFNAYGRIAARSDIDLVLHLGDYIYEYAQGEYGDPTLAGLRDVVPSNEIVSLIDYRLRHALYKTDPDLQEAHRMHPFICVWDDHETANDSWRDGAQNHNPEKGEGEWAMRRRAAIRAYYEYMPIRTVRPSDEDIYRRFRIGNLADLIMLDTRLHGRDQQAVLKPGQADMPADDPIISDGTRSLLGFDQEAWLERQLWSSKLRDTSWRVLGQQVMMAQLSPTFGRTLMNPDQWDGYRPARERLFRHLIDNRISDNIVLTGDIHSSWGNDLTLNPWDGSIYNPETGAGVIGAEFVCPAVTSPGAVPDPVTAEGLARHLRSVSPHMKYINLYRRGYGVLDLNHERAQCEIYHVATVQRRSDGEQLASVLVSERGNNVVRAQVESPLEPKAPGTAVNM